MRQVLSPQHKACLTEPLFQLLYHILAGFARGIIVYINKNRTIKKSFTKNYMFIKELFKNSRKKNNILYIAVG